MLPAGTSNDYGHYDYDARYHAEFIVSYDSPNGPRIDLDNPCNNAACGRTHYHVICTDQYDALRRLDYTPCPEHGAYCAYGTDGHHH